MSLTTDRVRPHPKRNGSEPPRYWCAKHSLYAPSGVDRCVVCELNAMDRREALRASRRP